MLALALLQSAPQTGVLVYGPDPSPSCGSWSNAKLHESDLQIAQYRMWVEGFVSGLNWNSPHPRDTGPDVQAVLGWVDQYCAAHPLDNLVQASIALNRELDRRNQR